MYELSGVPSEVREALLPLVDNGELSATAVFDAAVADEASPLRRYFQWDLEEGWREANLARARHLVARVRIRVVEQTGITTRAFVNVKVGGEQTYVQTQKVLANNAMKDQVRKRLIADLQRAEADLRTFGYVTSANLVHRAIIGLEAAAKKKTPAA